jgi:hypothetical protein
MGRGVERQPWRPLPRRMTHSRATPTIFRGHERKDTNGKDDSWSGRADRGRSDRHWPRDIVKIFIKYDCGRYSKFIVLVNIQGFRV